MNVLNIPVSAQRLEDWRGFLAPEKQPFFLTEAQASALGLSTCSRSGGGWTDQEGDTFTVWAVSPSADRVAWFGPEEWQALSGPVQRQLLRWQVECGRGNVPLGRHFLDLVSDLPKGRFLWRREHLTPEVLARIVEGRGPACRREEVPQPVWDEALRRLPRVRLLAGTFSQGPGNCFGAVMGAAGLEGTEEEWTQREPFEAFLRERARPGGRDEEAGTVLVWRSDRGVEHAAVTLGCGAVDGEVRVNQGWAFQKAAQTWWTPRVVLPVHEVKRLNRVRGWRLERWQIQQ